MTTLSTGTPAAMTVSTTARSVLRYAALGYATGARSTAGVAALALSSSSADPAWLRLPAARVVTSLMAAGEAVGDQLPTTPSRLAPPALIARVVAAAGSGALLARRTREPLYVGALVAVAGSMAGAFAGFSFRAWASRKLGRDNYGAVAEDAAVAGVASWAVR